jgi:hypothetical protein
LHAGISTPLPAAGAPSIARLEARLDAIEQTLAELKALVLALTREHHP